LKKLWRNLGIKALPVLGGRVVCKMWIGAFLHLFSIIKERSLYPIDRFMADGTIYSIHNRFGIFKIDPLTIDQKIPEVSRCFSHIRELYIKNCYLKFHQIDEGQLDTVVDLGANRGMASVMFVPVAKRIIAIEALPQYVESIQYLVQQLNGYNNLQIGTYFVGKEDKLLDDGQQIVRFSTMMKNFEIEQIDFLKIDIEGSEFEIVDDIPWSGVKYVSMEIHHEIGSAETIVQKLKDHQFDVIMATNDLVRTHDFRNADYLFARNTTL